MAEMYLGMLLKQYLNDLSLILSAVYMYIEIYWNCFVKSLSYQNASLKSFQRTVIYLKK